MQLPLVNDESAWSGADFRHDASWIHTLSAPEVEELAGAAQRCLGRGMQVTAIGAPDGYINMSVEEGGEHSTYRLPVYSVHENVVSCRILRNTIEYARKLGYATYSQLETDALAYMDELVDREDLRLDMTLERGDMQFINNYTTLHARTEFEDFAEPERRRLMVRLWLRSFGLRRTRRAEHFKDYDGVEKTLERA